ncbi:LptA/OstA family protein [Deinococcus sonorensis]|uniref:LptA/OstA family protein n=2 Tax=Deinococcus sonorensis TaxID=309891 RepID=A0AAU7UBX3_9DEIO
MRQSRPTTSRTGAGPWLLAPLLLGLALAQGTPAASPSTPAPAAVPSTPSAPSDAPAADEGSSVQLTRTAKDGKTHIIRVVRTGSSDETGIFANCGPQDNDPPETPTISVFSESGAGGIRVSIDKNVIVAPLAVVTQQEGGDGHIEMSAGTARYLDEAPDGKTDQLSRCEVEATPKVAADTVHVAQGKTALEGSRLVYDESDGVARIDGPITFSRQNTDSTLSGTSERIEVNVDNETTTLVGGVVLKDGARTSRAERVEYDDAANVAILRGSKEQPASSATSDQTLTASVIRYNLDTGSVVALGPVSGEFQDGESGSGAGPAVTPSTPSAP